jgi:D-sedoheptulose 7-phosphate isomerase
MSPEPDAYFEQLTALSRAFAVTDREGEVLSFSDGIRQAEALVTQAEQRGSKLFFIGNGGSAAIASHQAIDYLRNGGIPALAFNDGALLTCLGNDLGYEQVFSKPLSMLANPGDVLIAISSSGQSANILAGARQASERGCRVITLSAFRPDNPLRQLGDLNFYVPTMAYGWAEISHLSICHCLLDSLIAKRQVPSSGER